MARIPTIDKRVNKTDELGPAATVATSTLKPREGGSHVVAPPKEPSRPAGPPLAFETRDSPEATTTVKVTVSGNLKPASSNVTLEEVAAEPVMLDLWCGACANGLWQVGDHIECRNKACPFVLTAKPGESPTGLNLDGAIAFLLGYERATTNPSVAEALASVLGRLSNTLDVDNDIIEQQPAWLIWCRQVQANADIETGEVLSAFLLNPVDELTREAEKLGEYGAAYGAKKKPYEPPAVSASAPPLTAAVRLWPGLLDYRPREPARNPYRRHDPDQSTAIPMLLWCPVCHARHIDEGEFAAKSHRTHQCSSCGLQWRPANVATVGVQFLPEQK